MKTADCPDHGRFSVYPSGVCPWCDLDAELGLDLDPVNEDAPDAERRQRARRERCAIESRDRIQKARAAADELEKSCAKLSDVLEGET